MIPFPVEGWHIVSVDQSIAAGAKYRPEEGYRRGGVTGVRVMVCAHGPRYDRFIEAARAGDDETTERITIYVGGYGMDFNAAMDDAVSQARAVDAKEPIPG